MAALAERPYRRLLAYTCWFGFANGLTGSAQSMFPERVLGVGYSASTLMQAGMRAGQAAIAPASGAWIARVGPRPVLFVAQLLVALGPLCFWAPTTWENLSRATKSCPITPGVVCVGFAFVLWIAYAPLNVALDGLKIGLADPRNNSPYVAVHHALSDLVNAATILAGGLLYDTLAAGDAQSLRAYGALFLAGWACRALAAPLALRLDPRREKP